MMAGVQERESQRKRLIRQQILCKRIGTQRSFIIAARNQVEVWAQEMTKLSNEIEIERIGFREQSCTSTTHSEIYMEKKPF